jgi:hypothetical protein
LECEVAQIFSVLPAFEEIKCKGQAMGDAAGLHGCDGVLTLTDTLLCCIVA